MRHQCTELPYNKFQRKQRKFKPRQSNSKNQQEHQQYERTNQRMPQANRKLKQEQTQKTDAQDVVTPHTCNVLEVLQADINVNTVRKLDISVICASRSHKNKHTRKGHINPKHTNYKLEDTLQLINIVIQKIQVKVRPHSASKCRSNQSKLTMKVVKHNTCLLTLSTS